MPPPPPPPAGSAALTSALPAAAPSPAAPRHLHAVPDVALDFDAAVRSLTPRLQRYATRRLGDRHEAEELVQEALLRAYQHRAELGTEDDVAAWTTCVLGRLVIDRVRVRARSTVVADVPEGGRVARDTAEVVVGRDQARMALDALDSMPPRQAAVLWAREVEGLAYDAIGERFGMTEPAVRSLLTRARKALRKEYATRGGTLPSAGLVLLAPWVSGTGWLERLRASLERTPGLAALGVVSAGLVTGALVVPLGPSSPDVAALPVVSAASSPEPAQLQVRSAPAAADPAPVVAQPVVVAPAAPAPPAAVAPVRPPTPLERTGLDDTCLSAGATGAGGADCTPATPEKELRVELPVDAAPLGVELPTVGSDRVPCQTLPTLPLTTCTTSGDPQ